jgi:putative component of membrane protein insertase Oxa1/YidC/SpoIIIJ protein YidD
MKGAKFCKFTPFIVWYYMQEFIQKYGFKGLVLDLIRLLKCNPFTKGGHDLVP